jgi:hypothetical protein
METFPELLEQAANGNADALSFLKFYMELGHRIDDIIDKPGISKEEIIQTFLMAALLFSHNRFFQAYRSELYPLVVASLNSYATSVSWEGATLPHRKTLSDILRSDGVQVIEFVALICGGIDRMRVLSPLLRENSWKTHHNDDGTPK